MPASTGGLPTQPSWAASNSILGSRTERQADLSRTNLVPKGRHCQNSTGFVPLNEEITYDYIPQAERESIYTRNPTDDEDLIVLVAFDHWICGIDNCLDEYNVEDEAWKGDFIAFCHWICGIDTLCRKDPLPSPILHTILVKVVVDATNPVAEGDEDY